MATSPPLTNILVLEFAGLAPGPFAGKLLSDFGARVLRIDRHSSQPTVAADRLASHKRSLRVNLKSTAGVALIRELVKTADVLIDPFRPGVLEKLGLGPAELRALNPRLVYARLAGFRREGDKYAQMAGHDINYIAVSGALSLLGRAGSTPHPPANLLADFAGGGTMCVLGILLALLARAASGRGQVVEANMVDGAAYLASFPRFLQMLPGVPTWSGERGTNLLDGGAPFYDTYRTKDGGFMAVGALEPQFYKQLLDGLLPGRTDAPDRGDPRNWQKLRELFTSTFLQRTRKEWEDVFDGTDACVTPIKTHQELRDEGFVFAPAVTLKDTPALQSDSWVGVGLKPGEGGSEALSEWWGLVEGREWVQGEEGARLKGAKARL